MKLNAFFSRAYFCSCSVSVFSIVLISAALYSQQNDTGGAKSSEVQTFRAGAKSIRIPAPSADLVETGSDYRVILDKLAPDTNRLVAAFVPVDSVDSLQKGNFPAMKKCALVEILRQAEFVEIGDDEFKQVVEAVSKQLGGDIDPVLKQGAEEADRKFKAEGGKSIATTIDSTQKLGLLFSKPGASGFGMIMPVTTNGVTTKMVVGTIVFHAQSRVLFGYLNAAYKDEDTVKWVRTTGEAWADAILNANR